MIISLHSPHNPVSVSFASPPLNYSDRICKITKEELTITLDLLPGSYNKAKVSHVLQKISELGGGKGLYFDIHIQSGCAISLNALKTLALGLSPFAMAIAFRYHSTFVNLNLHLVRSLYSVNCPVGIFDSRVKSSEWLRSQQQ